MDIKVNTIATKMVIIIILMVLIWYHNADVGGYNGSSSSNGESDGDVDNGE